MTLRPRRRSWCSPTRRFARASRCAGAPRPFRLPPMKTFTLASGIEVYLVEQHALPLVSMDLDVRRRRGGRSARARTACASVCMAMLTEGTEKLDKLAYAERLADIASSIGGYAGGRLGRASRCRACASTSTPTFALFVDTLRTPGLRASDFDRMIKRRIEGIKQSKGSPAVDRGAGQRRGAVRPRSPVRRGGHRASLAAITLDDCRAFARRVAHAEARAAVRRRRPDRGAGARAASIRRGSRAGPAPARSCRRCPRPGRCRAGSSSSISRAPRSRQVSYLQFGPRRTAPDYFATSMMAAVLGGGFASRINMNLREDKGYSYGARGGFSYTQTHGAFVASAPVAGNATYQSVLRDRPRDQGPVGGKPELAIRPTSSSARRAARSSACRAGSRPRRPRSASTARWSTSACRSTTTTSYVDQVARSRWPTRWPRRRSAPASGASGVRRRRQWRPEADRPGSGRRHRAAARMAGRSLREGRSTADACARRSQSSRRAAM